MSSSLYSAAIKLAESGVRHDTLGELELAIQAYEGALEKMRKGMTIDTNAEQKKTVTEEAERYSTRVTLLKYLLSNSNANGALGVVGAVAGRDSGGGGRGGALSALPLTSESATATPLTATTALVSVVSSLTEQARGLVREVQAAQEEAEARLVSERRARLELEEANRELSSLRDELQAVMGAAEVLERERDSALLELKGPVSL